MTGLTILFSACIFTIGSFGMLLSQRHLIIVLLSLELMLLSVNINFVISSVILDDIIGQIYALMILAIAAAETAIGLAIVVVYYRLRGGISMDLIKVLRNARTEK